MTTAEEIGHLARALLRMVEAGETAREALRQEFFSAAWACLSVGQLDGAEREKERGAARFEDVTGERATQFLIPLEAEIKRQRMLGKFRD